MIVDLAWTWKLDLRLCKKEWARQAWVQECWAFPRTACLITVFACWTIYAQIVYANNMVYDECLSFLWEYKAWVTEVSHTGAGFLHDWLPIKPWTPRPRWDSLVGNTSYVLSHLETFPFANFTLYALAVINCKHDYKNFWVLTVPVNCSSWRYSWGAQHRGYVDILYQLYWGSQPCL